MNQLTHWNPFKALTRAASPFEFDDVFRAFPMRPLLDTMQVPDIRVDVSETDTAYAIKADIPGAKKEDIDVSVEGRLVTISARTAKESEKKDATSLYRERSEGQVFRSFSLPGDVDQAKAEARYENGVLDLTLPKKGNGNNHRIKVS